ncbi:GDYXXLXY domain-containing protein [Rhodoferax sp. AJA081-3]|uniref:GDYXXLXY domain-containing protein n=1 Tax=Rhodoferax sp. AJA081-3 TaxID=2752316 RepID=UPI001AE02083|nr:GDYXXLXY domain-containing protein [Rhodoferax sp. AJA081-3]QTN26922.1 GDYXXLXY domain-containing protein [Rhodoferax sp. AJA081-3]
MSADRLDHVLRAASAAGVLPAEAHRPEQDHRPWPVVLLTALGAWLAAVPLLIFVGLMVGEAALRGTGTYVVGAVVLAGAVALLRGRTLPLFVEQLAVPALMVGGALLGYALFRDLPNRGAAAVSAGLVGAVVWAVSKPWLRALLGAGAAGLVGLAVAPISLNVFGRSEWPSVWLALHVLVAVALAGAWIQRTVLNDGRGARLAAAWESLSVGWLLVTLAGLAFWAGMTFLVGASLGGGGHVAGEIARELGPKHSAMLESLQTLRLASVALALAGAAWLAHVWPRVRNTWCAAVALVLVGLAGFMPSLGSVWLVLAYCVSAGRWRVASAAGVAAAWIMGAFYYQLAWPLADKALLLAGAGAVLGALAWWAARTTQAFQAPQTIGAVGTPAFSKSQAGLAFAALLVLLVANGAIWQKENLISRGQPLFVPLAPVDPRSLMQGDYMALRFAFSDTVGVPNTALAAGQRPHVVATRDARGIATVVRVDQGTPLAADELRIELAPKNGDWVLVTDAWFFKEGEADRWAQAKYGEFRVGKDGRALLVGLRGADLKVL